MQIPAPPDANVPRESGDKHWSWLRKRPLTSGFVCVYAIVTLVFFLFASETRLTTHTPYNHFAHLADSWLNGRLHLEGAPPEYARNNDFVRFEGKWYVAFPPFPAVILLPFVWFADEVELVRDGQIFLWVAGLAPAFLFLALERVRGVGLTNRTWTDNVVLSLCFAWGTVFFFTAEQGTVWFAAHVVGAVCAAVYLWASIGVRSPLLAGAAVGLGLLTRASLVFSVVLFAAEVLRVCHSGRGTPAGGLSARTRHWCLQIRWPQVARAYALFSVPVVAALTVMFWLNYERFGHPLNSGYEHLTVAWAARMKEWGLFHYHYLSRNLAVLLTGLPWVGRGQAPFVINAHGLALWFTTPIYLWLLWPRRRGALHWTLWATAVAVAIPTLFYQNSGWAQFGYRFSNDYSVFLFALLALGGPPLRGLFALAMIWSIAVNAFGAASFDRKAFRQYYHYDGSQKVLFEPD